MSGMPVIAAKAAKVVFPDGSMEGCLVNICTCKQPGKTFLDLRPSGSKLLPKSAKTARGVVYLQA